MDAPTQQIPGPRVLRLLASGQILTVDLEAMAQVQWPVNRRTLRGARCEATAVLTGAAVSASDIYVDGVIELSDADVGLHDDGVSATAPLRVIICGI